MLGRNKNKKTKEQRVTMANADKQKGDEAISVIATGMTIVGDCETDGTVRIEGRIEGTIRAGKSVVVGRGGDVEGDIFTQDAVISGRVSGNISADSRLELQSTCDIQGEIRSRRVQLDEGAKFNGEVHMEEAGSGSPSAGAVIAPKSGGAPTGASDSADQAPRPSGEAAAGG